MVVVQIKDVPVVIRDTHSCTWTWKLEGAQAWVFQIREWQHPEYLQHFLHNAQRHRSTSPLKTDLCQVHIWRCRRELRLLTGVVWRIELFLLSSKWGRDLDYRHLHLSPLSYQRRKWLPDSCQSSEPIRLLAAELCELRLSSYLSFLSHYCIEDC